MIIGFILVVMDFGREEVRIFYPFPKYDAKKIQKKSKYNQRVLDGERGRFTRFVFIKNGASSFETRGFYKRLDKLISNKLGISYRKTSTWVKRNKSLSLPRKYFAYIRGTLSKKHYVPTEQNIDVKTTNNLVRFD